MERSTMFNGEIIIFNGGMGRFTMLRERSTMLNGKTQKLSSGPWLQQLAVSHCQRVAVYCGSLGVLPSYDPAVFISLCYSYHYYGYHQIASYLIIVVLMFPVTLWSMKVFLKICLGQNVIIKCRCMFHWYLYRLSKQRPNSFLEVYLEYTSLFYLHLLRKFLDPQEYHQPSPVINHASDWCMLPLGGNVWPF